MYDMKMLSEVCLQLCQHLLYDKKDSVGIGIILYKMVKAMQKSNSIIWNNM